MALVLQVEWLTLSPVAKQILMNKLIKTALMYSPIGRVLGKIPFVPDIYLRKVWAKRINLFYGLFNSYQEAVDFAARHTKIGWDDPDLARLLIGEHNPPSPDVPMTFQTSQYAVLLWLSKLLAAGSRVIDLGGAGGTFYELAGHFGLMPAGALWHVVDMPEVVRLGQARHERLGSQGISFGSTLSEIAESDILIALGVLQYMPDPLGQAGEGILEALDHLPRHILINKLPISDAPDVWSLQNELTTACPYRLFNRGAFMAYFEGHGYHLRDHWIVPELSADIPFHPQNSLAAFEGFYFIRD
jgi:putative methyltransferase (TIGR04325 family)